MIAWNKTLKADDIAKVASYVVSLQGTTPANPKAPEGEIWEEEYAKVGVKHLSAGAWDPCHFATKKPVNSLKDLKGLKIFTYRVKLISVNNEVSWG